MVSVVVILASILSDFRVFVKPQFRGDLQHIRTPYIFISYNTQSQKCHRVLDRFPLMDYTILVKIKTPSMASFVIIFAWIFAFIVMADSNPFRDPS